MPLISLTGSEPRSHFAKITIHDLPPELIAHIFKYSLSLSKGWKNTARRLILVCRVWKDIMETTPRLWTVLDGRFGGNYIRSAVQRSGKLPVSLWFDDDYCRIPLDDYLAAVSGAASRWRSVDLRVRRLPSSYGALESSTYRTIEILKIDCSVDEWDDSPIRPIIRRHGLPSMRLFGGQPAPLTLKELELQTVEISLPALRPSSLSSLTLIEMPSVVLEDLLSVLKECPTLVNLHLADLKGFQIAGMAPSEPIHLESLKHCHYRLPKPALCILLNILHTPSLITTHINLNIRVRDHDPARDHYKIFDSPVRGFSLSTHNLLSSSVSIEVNRAGESYYLVNCGGLTITFDPMFHLRWEDYLAKRANTLTIFSQADVLDSLAQLLRAADKLCPAHLLLTGTDIPGDGLVHLDEACVVRELSLLYDYFADCYVLHVLRSLADPTLFSRLEILRYDLDLGGEDLLVETLNHRYSEPPSIDNEGSEPLPLREMHFFGKAESHATMKKELIEGIRKAVYNVEIYWKGELVSDIEALMSEGGSKATK